MHNKLNVKSKCRPFKYNCHLNQKQSYFYMFKQNLFFFLFTTINKQKPSFYPHFHIYCHSLYLSLCFVWAKERWLSAIWSFQKMANSSQRPDDSVKHMSRDGECRCVILGEGADEHHSSTQSWHCSEAQPWPFVSFPILLILRVSRIKLLSSLYLILSSFCLFI